MQGATASPAAAATRRPFTARETEVAAAAQLACLLEVRAPKPGNVSPVASFRDATYEDFLASAVAIGPALAAAAEHPLGVTIRTAVEATALWVPSNTNLGLVLLLAPLARAALRAGDASLRTSLHATLAETTVADARETYSAIRRAAPGGLGRSVEQDVADAPTVTLRDTMVLAAGRDAIAREYATDFRVTFETGAPALQQALAAGLSWSDAVLEAYLTLLAAWPDTHISRKLGNVHAVYVQRRARAVLAAGGVRTPAGREGITALDHELRDERNTKNPGATADLTGAAIYVVLLEGGWRREGKSEGEGEGEEGVGDGRT
jgi:triphosphoribosyl-dephospho-CoA synthase